MEEWVLALGPLLAFVLSEYIGMSKKESNSVTQALGKIIKAVLKR